jgi:hypothetical protein
MKELLDSFWRAAAYCLHPRVIGWSLLPLLLIGGAIFGLGYFFWETAVDAVRAALESWLLVASFLQWLDSIGAAGFRSVLAPLIVVALTVPVVITASLLLVVLMMAPALTRLVATRRFPGLEARHGGGFWSGLGVTLGCTVVALVALVASMPLWFIPPLVLLVPPLIWGWLTYRVMTYDVLSEHASADERRLILRLHRWPLLAIGVACGYVGAVPSLLWIASKAALIFAPLLMLVAVWLYTLVFAFSALWFAHYALSALSRLRTAAPSAVALPSLP